MCNHLHLIFTSDTHGAVFPVSYATGQAASVGLLNLAHQIKRTGQTLILDGGDTLQGSRFCQYYLENPQAYPGHPLAEAMNALGVQYFTLGNHDFNFGYEPLKAYLEAVKGQCLVANVIDQTGQLPLKPWAIHVLSDGTRVGLTGAVTDHVKIWEQPAHLTHFEIQEPLAALQSALADLQAAGVDLTICLYHGGFEEDPITGRLLSESTENRACALARTLDFDLLLTGHQHLLEPGRLIAGTWAVQPPANVTQAIELVGTLGTTPQAAKQLDRAVGDWTEVQRGIGKRWSWASHALPIGETPDPVAYAALKPFEDQVQKSLDIPLGSLEKAIALRSKLELALEGSEIADLINAVQLQASGADFSCTSLPNPPLGLPETVTWRELVQVYPFDNTLEVLTVDESILRQALERCATYLTLEAGEPKIASTFLVPKIEHYNYDFYAGLDYAFDLRKPEGQRVVRLRHLDGRSLGTRTYRLALNSYRASGTGGYPFFRSCPRETLPDKMQDLLAMHLKQHAPVKIPQIRKYQIVWKESRT